MDKQTQISLGTYKICYEESKNQKDYQKALKYILQVTGQKAEYEKQWHSEIIECLLALKLYNQCVKKIDSALKSISKQDYTAQLENYEALVVSYLGLYNLPKANECIKHMDSLLSKLSSSSEQKQGQKDFSQIIQDLKFKVDGFNIISQDQRLKQAEEYRKLELSDEDSQFFKKAGQEVYLIPTQWLNKWKEFSSYKEKFEQSDNMEDEEDSKKTIDQIYPGPIDASNLVETYVKNHLIDANQDQFFENYVLKSDKAEKHDFEIVSKQIGDFLYEKYGGFKVKRMTILNPITNEVNVELFFKKINFIPIPTLSPDQKEDSYYTIYISKFASLKQLNDKIKRSLEFLPQKKNQILNRQYFKLWKLSTDLMKNYQNVYKTMAQKYREPTIQLDVKDIVIGEDECIDDMQLTDSEIILYELSETNNFKIVPCPQRKQSSKKESENKEDYQQQSINQNSQSTEIIDESDEIEGFPTGKIKIRRIDESHVRNMMQKYRIQNGQKGFSGKKGLCGLQNLGNTCFMNSALQCLSNVEELTTFMVNNEYVNDLNPDNPLGANGHLAVSYADLVRDIWQGGDSSVSPHYLKKVIGKFAPQFYGYSQQDSQELLSYLLDGLHEDLNRIKKKPVVEAIDYSGGKDQEMSLEFFKNYKKRNDSVISDLMVGQFKSTLVCPDKNCGKISITFDPFLTLSVPIPRVTKEDVSFYIIFKDPRKTPYKIETQIRSDSSLGELKKQISDNLNIPCQSLIFANNAQSKIEEFLKDDERGVHIKEISGICFVYEVEKVGTSIKDINQKSQQDMEEEEQEQDKEESPQNKKTSPITQNDGDQIDVEEEEEQKVQNSKKSVSHDFVYTEIEFCQIMESDVKLNSNVSNTDIHNVSYSRLVSLKYNSKVQDLYLQIYRIVRVYLHTYQQANGQPEVKIDIDIANDSRENLLKELSDLENNPQQKCLFRIFNKDMTPIDYKSQEPLISLRVKTQNRLKVKMVLDHKIEVKLMRTKRCESYNFESQKTSKEVSSGSADLYDCIDAFVKKEQLEKGNEWYCSKCKRHVLATKQMEIYNTPKILIIHLKRFKSGNVRNFGRYYFESGGKKINDLIDFPIENLDMTKYVLGSNGKPQIYDLFAVSQHYGGMGGGHYTACAQNFLNKRWYNFNDSHVSQSSAEQAVCSAAYVLFYRRRD
ncbi:ubiquitin carboxyl-terminal hydrolase (macronuclear) [Tetrahymena thermophila SB210]|uniref:ubiquitinyl hydrolase 1 n=1 Tax=Tetrahymena thermophila (strain SB210) TaxID=312017 RepID=I7M5W9_TETTS|nr:ubiquitin carboxyl-terminal hydrolase [Tetrahymena thermophila SB210]EAR83728.2 ubiquitin carboxyl-terminal hydrolase [Tetrahymena thermophila SB210]|eukprot:XP_001031391.2 ubiquitin carboxyl-terminal hydrolase [Tetrahymena thermophila SB210]